MANTTTADLIVEDGTGLATATSYLDIATADEYHRIRGNESWADLDDDTEKVPALILATDYVDRRWRFVGQKFVETQALSWPRDVAVDCDGIDQSEIVPEVIEKITAEYAFRASLSLGTNVLMPDPDLDPGGFITRKFEKVGPLECETVYDSAQGITILQSFPNADRILLQSGLVIANRSGRVCRA